MAGAALDWTSLPRGSIIVDVGGGIGEDVSKDGMESLGCHRLECKS